MNNINNNINMQQIVTEEILDYKKTFSIPETKGSNEITIKRIQNILQAHNQIIQEKDNLINKLQEQIKKEREVNSNETIPKKD